MEQLNQSSVPPYGAPPYGQAQYIQAVPYGHQSALPTRKKRGSALTIIASIVVVFAVLVGIGIVAVQLLDDGSQQELDAYMEGKGVSYRLPGDSATVRLAVEPKYESNLTGAPTGADAQVAIIERRHYEMAFGRVSVPGLQGAEVRSALVDSAKGGATAASVRIGAIQDVRVDGYPAVWAHGTVKGDEVDITTVYADGKVYILSVHTDENSTDVQRELERSFKVGS